MPDPDSNTTSCTPGEDEGDEGNAGVRDSACSVGHSPEVRAMLARHAPSPDCAVLIGDRAGVVEWANASWTRITGFPLEATVAKPITHFLDEADFELALVDFVGQRFVEGGTSSIEFPFETFDGRSIWVHLDVHPVRNALGEIAEFVAIASDSTERRTEELASAVRVAETESHAPSHGLVDRPQRPSAPTPAGTGPWAWIDAVEQVCRRARGAADPRIHFDVALDPAVPRLPGSTPRLLLEEAASALLGAACAGLEETWGCVTVMAGRTRAGRSHLSEAHPIPARPSALARASWIYLEVHDTGPTIDPGWIAAAHAGAAAVDPRARRIALAAEIVQAMGGVFHLDSTPGCGTQALALLHRLDRPPSPRTEL